MPRDPTEPANPLDGPMTLHDYGILDGLRGTELPRVTDLFYTERLEFLPELGELVVHEETEDFMDLRVRSKA
jgi:hypothetical protein